MSTTVVQQIIINSSSSSSGSEGGLIMVDDRKKKRMISNRESARRSRMKKQKHLDDLLNQIVQLDKENNETAKRFDSTTQLYVNVESQNKILRAEVMDLTNRLQSLNSVLHIVQEVSGLAMDIPEIPDPLLKPWKIPCPPSHNPIPIPIPIMASFSSGGIL